MKNNSDNENLESSKTEERRERLEQINVPI